jgi:hypothetical protein
MRNGKLGVLFAFAIAFAAVGAACGTHRPGGGGDGGTGDTLQIAPATVTLQVNNGVAATQVYTATLVHADGSKEDVTANTQFGIDSIGAFTGSTLTVTEGGKAMIAGFYGDNGNPITGQAEVISMLSSVRIDPSLPPNTPGLFGGTADPSRAPSIVYPPAATIMPRNIGDFEVHWTDASNNNIWEVSLHTAYSSVLVYVPATTPANWTAFLPAEWAAAVGNDTSIDFQVRGVSTTSPGLVGTAPLQTVGLSNEQMDGGLYYWATQSTTGGYGIFRHDMSKPGQPAEEYMTTDQTGGRCVACHVLSKDGTKMAVTFDGGGGSATFVDVASSTPQPISANWNFGSFTPDGRQFFSIEMGALVLRDYTNQTVVATVPTTGAVTHVDVAMDGTLVYTAVPTTGQIDWSISGGQIVTQSFDQTSMMFGTPKVIVANANNNYYPSWSPDGQWILFNAATDGNASYNNASTELWVVKADGSAPPVRLANADAATGQTNSWGRWAPFQQTFGASSEAMYWVTVSSKRDFGVRLVGQAWPQIWMTPFFADRAAMGMDPSVAMFRLPFQNITSKNHIAQWTEKVVGVNVRGK